MVDWHLHLFSLQRVEAIHYNGVLFSSFCCDKPLQLKTTLGKKGLGRLTLPGHSLPLREVRVELKKELEAETIEGCCLLGHSLAHQGSFHLALLHSPRLLFQRMVLPRVG